MTTLSQQITYSRTLFYKLLSGSQTTRKLYGTKPCTVLGIETSCDDTSCGIIQSNKRILSEAKCNQIKVHAGLGGIIPPLACDLHQKNITEVCEKALNMAKMKVSKLDAIAVTTGPGLQICLEVGLEFAKYLHQLSKKPVIPIHHMQAHALTARMCATVDFPYLALLASGGHCLLAIVNNPREFYILGSTLCNAPGEQFDKVARRLKLHSNQKFAAMHGGQAIEYAAESIIGNENKKLFPESMLQYYDCTFSFSGLTTSCLNHIKKLELEHELCAGQQLPEVNEIAAAYQYSVVRHICQRTQRAMEFFKLNFSQIAKPMLVLGGGVAANNYLGKALAKLCRIQNFGFVQPPAKYCTDNGVMVAWNGIEKLQLGIDVLYTKDQINKLEVKSKLPIGIDWTDRVAKANIKCTWADTP